ncbi:MAG: hypothetical protein H0W55_03345 [Actinobacteria bacterium]|nr:hypothetical protein [Actinomycetota bacterium]
MIEVQMVARMMRRGLWLAPILGAGLWLWGGPLYVWSGVAGLGMALLNLWLSARLIGGVADRNPQLLMVVGLATFVLGLILVTCIALVLNAMNLIFFPVTGVSLIGSHLVLVVWEASGGPRDAMAPTSKTTTSTRRPTVRS